MEQYRNGDRIVQEWGQNSINNGRQCWQCFCQFWYGYGIVQDGMVCNSMSMEQNSMGWEWNSIRIELQEWNVNMMVRQNAV